MTNKEYLGKILAVEPGLLEKLDSHMAKVTGREGVLDKVADDNRALIEDALKDLNGQGWKTQGILRLLKDKILSHEKQLLAHLETVDGEDQFEKAARLAREISQVGDGFFLKREFGEQILKKSRPEHLLDFLGYGDVDEMLSHVDVTEVFSALRFIETDEWMHETFEKAYSDFTADDFEIRPIEIKVLGSQWKEVAQKFVEKKHHNVSHLKEFGIIFLNPIAQDLPGKFMRDFALLFHYFNEIEFYAKLFKKHSSGPDFAERLKSLLRGDVPEASAAGEGDWLVVQRYLWKVDLLDPRLYLPRINPESVHWRRGERDLTTFGTKHADIDTEFWANYDWVADYFEGNEWLISFDMEDNAMSLVSEHEGKIDEYFTYHQREAMWTHIFEEYVGGEDELMRLLMDNFERGVISFQ